MTIEERIANLEKELAELKEEIKFKSDGLFKPNINEKYFCYTSYGIADCGTWNNNATDNSRYAVGNVFRTEEEAEFAVEKLKVIHELKQFADSKNRKWDDGICHWTIGFDFSVSSIKFQEVGMTKCKYGELYFPTKEIAKHAVAVVGIDRVKEYYLEVEE